MFGPLFDLASGAPSAAPQFAAPAPTQPDWQGIDFLVGGTWTAKDNGWTYQESVIRTLNGSFLTSVATSTPSSGQAVVTNGYLGIDSSGKTLLMWGFRSDGTVVEMRQVANPPGEPAPPKPTWIFEGVSRGQRVRQMVIQTDSDGMMTTASILVQGKWQANPPLPYSRMITTAARPGGGLQPTTDSQPDPEPLRPGPRRPRR